MMRILILGGTTEASALARLLAGDVRFAPTLSFAGRTSAPVAQPIATRSGGFGGIDGLVGHLAEQRIGAVVDATHPYADQMSRHAVAACARLNVPLASVVRPAWRAGAGDRWTHVPDTAAAVGALGRASRRVFLSLGRLELAAFAGAPQHTYVARLIEPAGEIALPPEIEFIHARGPFQLPQERALLKRYRIELIVSKNSGGSATYAKIEAARMLTIPVVMIARPDKPHGRIVDGAAGAHAWLLERARDLTHGRDHEAVPPPRSDRGV